MSVIKRKLREEFETEIEQLGKMQLGTDEYIKTVDGVTKLADRAIEIEDRFIKNCLTGVSTVGGLTLAFLMGVMSMNFEREGTFTTEAGRSSIRQLLKFK